jgi:hypothetical protein
MQHTPCGQCDKLRLITLTVKINYYQMPYAYSRYRNNYTLQTRILTSIQYSYIQY